MRRWMVAWIGAAVATAAACGAASAAFNDFRMVTGRILIWPPEQYGERVAVIEGEDGARYFVRFTPATTGVAGLEAGDGVTVIGREGAEFHTLWAVSAHEAAPGRAHARYPGWRTVRGVVQSRSGTDLVLVTDDGRSVIVDASAVPDLGDVGPGRSVTVVGTVKAGAVLAARGVAVTDPPARRP